MLPVLVTHCQLCVCVRAHAFVSVFLVVVQVLISDGAPGFYRKTAGPSPVMWGGSKGDGRLAQMDSRTF